jgi:hypothetical protein
MNEKKNVHWRVIEEVEEKGNTMRKRGKKFIIPIYATKQL